MKPVLSLFLLVLTSMMNGAGARATEIDGKWGLGVAVGSLVSSRAEASILRGVSSRTAWILDVTVNQGSSHSSGIDTVRYSYPDTIITRGQPGNTRADNLAITVGPRLRRFTRPGGPFSPYWDLYAHFFDRTDHQSYRGASSSSLQVGGEAGFAIGVEYFSTRWPFSVGAHTNVASFSVSHTSSKYNATDNQSYASYAATRTSSGTAIYGTITLSPSLQVRVYF